MHIRRAIGATALALTATAALSGCADDPKDKAFGGLGDIKDLPSAPSMPAGGPSSLPSGMPSPSAPGLSGGSSDLPSAPSAPSSPAVPTYNSNALGEVVGQNCRYSRATSQIKFDVNIQNSSSDTSFTYSFAVQFKVGSSPDSNYATVPAGIDSQTATVGANGDRKVTMQVSHPTNQRLAFSCQVTRATKSPS